MDFRSREDVESIKKQRLKHSNCSRFAKQTIKLEVKINYPKMSGIQIELE